MPPKPIVLTLDHGDHGVYQYAYPALKRYEFHFVVFLITRWAPVHTVFYMGKSDVLDMLKSGLAELGSHTRNHVDLHKVSPIRTLYEVCVSKRDIKKLFDYNATSFCFPFGGHTKIAIGIKSIRVCYGDDDGWVRQWESRPLSLEEDQGRWHGRASKFHFKGYRFVCSVVCGKTQRSFVPFRERRLENSYVCSVCISS